MKLETKISYTIKANVCVIPCCIQEITIDVVAENKLDAFATAKEVIAYMYQFTEDSILDMTLIEEKPIYKVK